MLAIAYVYYVCRRRQAHGAVAGRRIAFISSIIIDFYLIPATTVLSIIFCTRSLHKQATPTEHSTFRGWCCSLSESAFTPSCNLEVERTGRAWYSTQARTTDLDIWHFRSSKPYSHTTLAGRHIGFSGCSSPWWTAKPQTHRSPRRN
jgi:hypothetical protein